MLRGDYMLLQVCNDFQNEVQRREDVWDTKVMSAVWYMGENHKTF